MEMYANVIPIATATGRNNKIVRIYHAVHVTIYIITRKESQLIDSNTVCI